MMPAEPVSLDEWAARWNIPAAALDELCRAAVYLGPAGDTPEAIVQNAVRLEAARLGKHLFRNNRGAGKLASGSFVRFGLANDSERLGKCVKSADLIGWEPVVVTSAHVGETIARFLSVECKRGDWKPRRSLEDDAQSQWAAIVNASGGRGLIVNGTGQL